MKIINLINKLTLLSLFSIAIGFMGCEETAPISVDPISKDTLFTFTPSHGYPGASVIIKGAVVNGIENVSIGSKLAEIKSTGSNELTIVVPIGAKTEKIKLIKSDNGGVITSIDNFLVDDSPVPTVITFTPEIVGSAKEVVITGNFFNIADSVFIGDKKAEIISKTDTEIKITTPVGFVTASINMYYDYITYYGIKKVGISESQKQLVLALPVIASIEPSIGAVNVGDKLTVSGSMFTSVEQVLFGTVADTNFVIKSDDLMEIVVPAGATTGKIYLVVADGQSESAEDFNVNLPTITEFVPGQGGDIPTRTFTVLGTKLTLVEKAIVGGVEGTIETQRDDLLTFTITGGVGGFMELVTKNGIVKSAAPFLLFGDIWLADYDNQFSTIRLFNEPMYTGAANSEQWADITVNAKTIENDGGDHANYRRWDVTFDNAKSPRLYLRGDQGSNANPAPDRFLLYTNNSQGMTFEFDIAWESIPAELVVDNKVTLKVMFFNADQTAGGGYGYYSGLIEVEYNGSNAWRHVIVDCYACNVANDSYMYNTEVPEDTGVRFAPNNCRIITVMFPGAYGETAAAGKQMVVNFDNWKFKITGE